MRLSMAVAMDRNRVIGSGGGLPWHLPADLRRFREITMGRPILMGRRTHESIGRPLPGRLNLVLTRNPAYRAPGCAVVTRLDEAYARAGVVEELVVIGGADLFTALMPATRRIYLTEVDAEVRGDVHFPALEPGQWLEVQRQRFAADGANPYPYSFVLLERLPPRESAFQQPPGAAQGSPAGESNRQTLESL